MTMRLKIGENNRTLKETVALTTGVNMAWLLKERRARCRISGSFTNLRKG